MLKPMIVILLVAIASFSLRAEESLIRLESKHSVKETADKFVAVVKQKGFNVFARINHQGNAEKVEMELKPTEVK